MIESETSKSVNNCIEIAQIYHNYLFCTKTRIKFDTKFHDKLKKNVNKIQIPVYQYERDFFLVDKCRKLNRRYQIF